MSALDPRRMHYGRFYGIAQTELDESDARPLLVVVGNCQAESLRVLLAEAPSKSVRTVRIPPVFELERDDMPYLARLLAQTDILLSQPIRDNYRGLPLGTSALRAGLAKGGRTVLWPIIRYTGLFPWQAIVRHPGLGDPPVVPYHDLRTLALVSGITVRPNTPEQVRAVGAASQAELRRRELRDGSVAISDVLSRPTPDLFATINHPGNAVLIELARRIQERLGLPVDAADPGRVLLRSVFAPLDPVVCQAWQLSPADARPAWLVDGVDLADDIVRGAQIGWYEKHPEMVAAALNRCRETMELLHLRH